ncbi:MAG: hypothetical protein OEV55_02105 [candidate division Zixibacteria bacterium]|nr:hypothetical protein [candidate division Zixibacteria bacterium]
MKSRKLILGILLIVLGVLVSGCVLYAGGVFGGPKNRYQHPRYCFDCHHSPHWTRVYVSCEFYDFYFVDRGYYYLPRHGGHRGYVFKKYSYSKDKDFIKHYEKYRISDKEKAKLERDNRKLSKKEVKKIEKDYREKSRVPEKGKR